MFREGPGVVCVGLQRKLSELIVLYVPLYPVMMY